MRLAERSVLACARMIEFMDPVVPDLTASDTVVVIVIGQMPDYREADPRLMALAKKWWVSELQLRGSPRKNCSHVSERSHQEPHLACDKQFPENRQIDHRENHRSNELHDRCPPGGLNNLLHDSGRVFDLAQIGHDCLRFASGRVLSDGTENSRGKQDSRRRDPYGNRAAVTAPKGKCGDDHGEQEGRRELRHHDVQPRSRPEAEQIFFIHTSDYTEAEATAPASRTW